MLTRPHVLFLCTIFTVILMWPSFGQNASGKGVVILQDEQVLFGHVAYHQDKELVSVLHGERQLTYASSQVKLFQFYDKEKSLNRVHQPFLRPSNKRYAHQVQIPEFFEVVLMDDMMILRKQKTVLIERVERDEKGSILAHTVASSPIQAIDYDYFVSYDAQHVNLITDFTEQVITKLDRTYHASIKLFIEDEKLDMDKWEDQYKILTHYQELKSRNLNPKLISKADLNPKSY